jgi:hypothetical protein
LVPNQFFEFLFKNIFHIKCKMCELSRFAKIDTKRPLVSFPDDSDVPLMLDDSPHGSDDLNYF